MRRARRLDLAGILCALAALAVALVRWPEAGSDGARSSLAERFLRGRDMAEVRRMLQARDVAGSAAAWQQLLRTRELDAASCRELFDHDDQLGGALLDRVRDPEWLASRLLMLGGTNREDVRRVMRMHAGRFAWQRVLDIAPWVSAETNGPVPGWMAQARLALGDAPAFHETWGTLGREWLHDARAKPWCLAAEAVMRDARDAQRARSELALMREGPELQPAAWEASLWLAFMTGDVAGHKGLLNRLPSTGPPRLEHAINQAELLANAGDRAAAAQFLQGLRPGKASEEEAATAVVRLVQLGFFAQSERLLDAVWKGEPDDMGRPIMGCLPVLLAGDWERCMSHALGLRAQPSTSGRLDALSYFLQGCSAMGLGKASAAKDAFDAMATRTVNQPEWMLRFVSEVLRQGEGRLDKACMRQAWVMARMLETNLGEQDSYWRSRAEAAGRARQVPDMMRSARWALRSDPRSADALCSVVRALLLSQEGNSEALFLSADLMRRAPALAEWRMLRAMALARGDLADEARGILQSMPEPSIHPQLRSLLGFAWLEIHVAAQDWAAARRLLARLRAGRMEALVSDRLADLAKRIPEP